MSRVGRALVTGPVPALVVVESRKVILASSARSRLRPATYHRRTSTLRYFGRP